ncbi:NUDIX hydrolase [Streptomonospora sp. PA3]|uniref:NUDIX hydrolase n=1 Tax=Streptomonospora sp. PA3 TaxID=2607326 RepID=UPI001CA4175C|nr:NUDIX hydrolase [Streptomonospora sp. PA3]
MATVRPAQWRIHATRLIGENRHSRLSTMDVEPPDGTRFTQYAAKMPPAAMTLVADDDWQVLLIYRHRLLIDQWVWELPGGYVDVGASAIVASYRALSPR